MADHQRSKQILINLLSNAVKYNRPGGEVVIRVEDREPDRLRISAMCGTDGKSRQPYGGCARPITPALCGYMPVCSDARLGLHCGAVQKLRAIRTPPAANRSRADEVTLDCP